MSNMEIKTMEDLLIAQKNKFAALIIGELLNIKRYSDVKKTNPSEVRINQMGQEIKIDELVILAQKNLDNAIEYLKHIDKLLKIEKAGKLEDEIKKELDVDYSTNITIPSIKDIFKK